MGHLSPVPLVIWGFSDVYRMTTVVMLRRLPAGACISLVFIQITAAWLGSLWPGDLRNGSLQPGHVHIMCLLVVCLVLLQTGPLGRARILGSAPTGHPCLGGRDCCPGPAGKVLLSMPACSAPPHPLLPDSLSFLLSFC